MQDHIFVLLMQTGTSVAKVLHFFTRKPYNHASVALDLTLEEMYSFCRNHIHFPLPAGFNLPADSLVEKTQTALFPVRGNPACTVRCTTEQTPFPAHAGRLAVYFRCPPHLSGRIEPLLSYICKVDSAVGRFPASIFKFCLIAVVPRTDTADSRPPVQKLE